MPGRVDHGLVHADADRHVRHSVRRDLRHRPRPDAGANPRARRPKQHAAWMAGGARRHGVRRCASADASRPNRSRRESRNEPRTQRTRGDHGHHEQGFIMKYLLVHRSQDDRHAVPVHRHGMALIGGFAAYVFRMQLAFPGARVPGFGRVSPAEYNALVTIHGSIMIFWVAMPVLIAGVRELPDPADARLRRHGVPAHQPAVVPDLPAERVMLLASFFVPGGAFGGAWTSYPPLSANAAYNLTPLGRHDVARRRGARVRGVPARRHQLRRPPR